jgi:hypothetical protein
MSYNNLIRKAYQSALQEGAVNGLGLGSVMAVLFCSYGLAVWYGSKLIVERGYNGGMIICYNGCHDWRNVSFVLLITIREYRYIRNTSDDK